MLPQLTLDILRSEAAEFVKIESTYPEPALYGVDNGKTIGTYIEQKFKAYLAVKYDFDLGNSANGIDLPGLNVDMKVTSLKQPQSSSPFDSVRQKIFGLGYHLLIFVYTKTNDHTLKTSILNFNHTVFVDKSRTADFETTKEFNKILSSKEPDTDDITAYMYNHNFFIDDIQATKIAEELIHAGKVEQGYLTISNAMQWRLQYNRVIKQAGLVDGVFKVL